MIDKINLVVQFVLNTFTQLWNLMTSEQLLMWVLSLWVVRKALSFFGIIKR